jgi:hypothetical protein
VIDPSSIHEEYEYIDEVPESIKLTELPVYDRYDYDLNDEKSFGKYIDAIEKSVRNSFEYRQMVTYLRDYLDMNKCAFYENVTNADNTRVRIEIHHAPFMLRDICLIVYNKRSQFNEPLDEEMVAKEVMYLHYKLWVGLIPLAETVHELVHNNYIFIPTTKVLGNWKEFYNRYEPYMTPEQIEAIENIIAASNGVEDPTYKTLLSKKYIYVDPSGAYDLPKMEDVAALLKGRIRDLMDTPQEPVDRPKEPKQAMVFDLDTIT